MNCARVIRAYRALLWFHDSWDALHWAFRLEDLSQKEEANG